MDCARIVEKEINFILCLGTTYDLSSMEDIGNSWSFLLIEKTCLSKQFYLSKKFVSQFTFMQFLFYGVSIYSYKAPTREHYYNTCALDESNI